MSAPFRFKQFTIHQQHAAMKVGTDGVLLGAWCPVSDHIKTVLDIGSGTGLLALMLAQRLPQVEVTAIEPHDGSFLDAAHNIKQSPWAKRIRLIQEKYSTLSATEKFDLIISNPPYYRRSTSSSDSDRRQARHIYDFGPTEFAQSSRRLNEEGYLVGIYPSDIYITFHKVAIAEGLSLHRKCEVKPNQRKEVHRILFSYGRQAQKNIVERPLVIEENVRHLYSAPYKELTKHFYLNF